MITTILDEEHNRIEVRTDGDKEQMESELIAIMINALSDFTPEDLAEMLAVAVQYRQEERVEPLPPVH